jgi:hypothetical protein
MPTNRRRKKRFFDAKLREEQLCHLCYGLILLPVGGFEDEFFPFESEEERRQLYFEYRDKLFEMRHPDKPQSFQDYEKGETE